MNGIGNTIILKSKGEYKIWLGSETVCRASERGEWKLRNMISIKLLKNLFSH